MEKMLMKLLKNLEEYKTRGRGPAEDANENEETFSSLFVNTCYSKCHQHSVTCHLVSFSSAHSENWFTTEETNNVLNGCSVCIYKWDLKKELKSANITKVYI
jgi:hypothetical protein